MLNYDIKGRLGGCFGGLFQGNMEDTGACFERTAGRRSMKGLVLGLFKRFFKNILIFNFSRITLKAMLLLHLQNQSLNDLE